MIIIWKGAGGLVLGIGLIVCLAMNILTAKCLRSPTISKNICGPNSSRSELQARRVGFWEDISIAGRRESLWTRQAAGRSDLSTVTS